jgi:hypothetical protein
MGTKHPHYDVIVAWANGEPVEHYEDGGWYLWVSGVPPYFEDSQYRIKPKRVKKEGWVNVYSEKDRGDRSGYLGWAWASKEEADINCTNDRIACVRIEWEEEE